MKPFKSTTMLRPLTDAELQLEDPQWEDDDTVTFYIPCWFNVDLFFPAFMWLRMKTMTTSTSTAPATPRRMASVCSSPMPTTVGLKRGNRILRSR